MQRDHGRDAALTQSAQHGPVTLQGIFVPRIRRRLDAAPLHRHAVRVLSTLRGAVEVLFPASAPPIRCQARRPLCVTFLFPLPPLVICVVALHLMRGGCRPP